MTIREKKYFYFTQNSLQTFTDCPLKFKKKYIDNIKWDGSDNITEKAEFGSDFHKIAERYFLGIPVFEESFKDNENLYNAYKNLKAYFPIEPLNKYFPEHSIRFSDGDIRLEANIDLLIVKPNNSVELWDFKTNSDKSKEKKYINSLQTQVYMFSVKKTAKDILGFDINCDKIKMFYYGPEKSTEIAKIDYNEETYAKQKNSIEKLINSIYNYDYRLFERNNYIKNCNFCEFNLFCDNKKESFQNEFSIDINWDEIEEIT